MASGEMSGSEFRTFLDGCLQLLARYSNSQSVHYLCILDWRNIETLLEIGSAITTMSFLTFASG